MKKKKVLLIAYNNLGKGGIQNQIVGIIRTLKDSVSFDVVVWDEVKDYYTHELERYGVNIIRCFRCVGESTLRKKMDAFVRYRDIRKTIDRVIRENGPYDAIHCNNAYDAAPCLDAAFHAGIPVRISHAHNVENPAFRKKKTYLAYQLLYAHHRKKIHQFATHMIGCSRQVTDYFFGKGIGMVVHIGIDLCEFEKTGRSKKNAEPFALLHVGNMSQQKNQPFLVEIMEKLIKLRTDVRLNMIGDGPWANKVRELISQKNLESYISILPSNTNVPQAMAEAALFVFPSTFEGFGIVLIEAQSVGLRCLASDVVSPEANCGGISYLPLEAGATYWAERISCMLDENCDADVSYDVSGFSVENMANEMLSMYMGV